MTMETSSRAPVGLDEKIIILRQPRSGLSKDAKEFVPKKSTTAKYEETRSQVDYAREIKTESQKLSNFQQTMNIQPPLALQTSSVQNRIQRYQHPNAHETAPNCVSYPSSVSSLTSSVQKRLNINDKPQSDHNSNYIQSEVVETVALEYLTTVIECLNSNPGSFDTVATRFLTIFDGMENNVYVLSNAMENIFNESIENPNFRYMGAKLYNLLHMLNLRVDSLFHTLLKCKLKYHQADVKEFMNTNGDQKVRETALFLAELYMQLRGDDTRIRLIAENIVFSLNELLTKKTTDNVRCVCLTLKLTGYDLDVDCPDDVKLIMQKLETINKETPGKYPLVQNVITLKRNNWGRSISQDHSSRSPSESSTRAATSPTHYGPDGKILTEEERQFVIDNLQETPPNEEEYDYDLEVDLDPEMDEETENDFRKFLKMNKQTDKPPTDGEVASSKIM